MADSTEPIAPVGATSAAPTAPETAPHAVAHLTPANDSVALSDTARATLLTESGESYTEIADQLGVTVSQVMADLQVVVTPSEPAVVPTTQKNRINGRSAGFRCWS